MSSQSSRSMDASSEVFSRSAGVLFPVVLTLHSAKGGDGYSVYESKSFCPRLFTHEFKKKKEEEARLPILHLFFKNLLVTSNNYFNEAKATI